jgi:hypothetical protein
MDDKKEKPSSADKQAYKQGREGVEDVLGTDSNSESKARQRGNEDKINADQTRKEQKKSDEKSK